MQGSREAPRLCMSLAGRGSGSFCCPNSGAAVASCGDPSLGGITYPFLFLSPFLKSCHRNTLGSPETLLKSISCIPGTSLLGQGLRLFLPVQGVWARSLVLWPINQNIKQKQHCNKFNKDFKNCPHQNKNL